MQLEFYKLSKEQKAFLLKYLLNFRKHKSFQPTHITYSYECTTQEHIVTFSSANENALQYVVGKKQKKALEYALSEEDSKELDDLIYSETILEKKGHPTMQNITEKLYAELSELVLSASKA